MTSELKVDKITPASGTNTQIGEAGDTTNLSAGTVTLPTSIITGATEKTSLVDADKFLIADSADSNAFKHVQKSNLPSGGLAFINSVTQSSNTAAVTMDNVFSATYDSYLLIFDATSNGNGDFIIHFRSSGGSPSTITASNYKYAFIGIDGTDASTETAYSNNNSQFQVGHGLYNNTQLDYPAISGFFYFNSPFSSTHTKHWHGNFITLNSNGDHRGYAGGGVLVNQTSLGGVRFSFSSNDVNNLTARRYGLVNS